MDSDSIGDRLQTMQISKCVNVENIKQSEEVPKILRPELHDVFHVFANMLDVTSFVKLAMTSKDMHRRCMKDRKIRINVEVDRITVSNKKGSPEFQLSYKQTFLGQQDSYKTAVQKLPCKINVRTLHTEGSHKKPAASMESVLTKLKKVGVNKIDDLLLRNVDREWEAVIAIIKDFGVKSVTIDCPVEMDVLRAILQLNLKKLHYTGPVPVDLILKIDSTIREIYLPNLENISQELLVEILSKIQSGSLLHLAMKANSVDLRGYKTVPFDYEGPLPDERPLVLEKTRDPNYYSFYFELWFLHWNGGVTKCDTLHDEGDIQMYKCVPWEYPWILRNEEDILEDLHKRPRVFCSANHFKTFCSRFTMLNSSHEGPLPKNRPLFCKDSENHFWLLDKDDNLIECTWQDCVMWIQRSNSRPITQHPALAKYMFWKTMKQVKDRGIFSAYCKGVEEFDCWFDGIEKLDFEYSGDLPSARPLFFEKSTPNERRCVRIVLLEDRPIECRQFSDTIVHISRCNYYNLPPILFTAKDVADMLKEEHQMLLNININFEIFRDGLELLKKSVLVLQNRLLICVKTTTEIWCCVQRVVRKIEWKEGRFTFNRNDLRGSPPSFMKQAFRYLFEMTCFCSSLILELQQSRSCLEQFTAVPFDYSGPLTSDPPMAFVKNEIRHTCRQKATCQCSEVSSILVYFLWNGTRLTKCTWGTKGPQAASIEPAHDILDAPLMLKSKEYLKNLLQANYGEDGSHQWFGCPSEFQDYIKDYTKLPFDYDDPLPEERPLLFEGRQFMDLQYYFLLREDDAMIECVSGVSSTSFYSLSKQSCLPFFIAPPALERML